MKVSLNWIRKYVDLPEDVTPEELAYELTMRTVEVESVSNPADLVQDIIVGRIISVEQHPDADKLHVCFVDCGTEEAKQIVCGGINLYDGEIVAVALPGASVVWHGEGEPVVLKETKLRGVKSEGMICSSTEINLGELFPLKAEAEILDLTDLFPDANPGDALSSVLELDDVILDIDNKSMTNRPDLWGHYGIARELAAIFGKTLRLLPAFKPPEDAENYHVEIVDTKRCARYDATLFENVAPVKSPFWMRRAVWSVGMRPINVLVDITNYVMLATGQPIHGFDQDHVRDGIRVRTAHLGETLELLDESVLDLHEDDLLICDGHDKPIGLAGVMGGARDSILPETSRMLLEVANFDASSIRQTVMRHRVRTEASNRFEKAIDTERCDQALGLAQYLMETLQPNARIAATGAARIRHTETLTVDVPLHFLRVRSGSDLSENDVRNTLEPLGFEVTVTSPEESHKHGEVAEPHNASCCKHDGQAMRGHHKHDGNHASCCEKDSGGSRGHCKKSTNGAHGCHGDDLLLHVKVPSWRATGDVSMRDDILEEVCRMIGYHHMAYQPPVITLDRPVRQLHMDRLRSVKEYLAFRAGLREIFTYPWVDDAFLIAAYGEDALTAKPYVTLATPPAPERSRLRRSLIPSLLEAVVNNLRYYNTFGLFNTETVFLPEKEETPSAVSAFSESSDPTNSDADARLPHVEGDESSATTGSDAPASFPSTASSVFSTPESLSQKGDEDVEHLPEQQKHLGIALAGDDAVKLFRTLKGILENLPRYAGVEPFRLTSSEDRAPWADRNAFMAIEDQTDRRIGVMGILSPKAASRAGIKQGIVALAEIDFECLVPLPSRENRFESLPQFPLVEQDLSIIVDQKIAWSEIQQAIRKDVKKVEFVEEYYGEQVPEGKKSIMFRFWLGSDKGTMTPEQIDKARSRIIRTLAYLLGAEMR